MKPIVGIVVALPAEARALAGRSRWRPVNNAMFHHIQERNDLTFIYVQSGIGNERSLAAAKWLVAQGARLLASVGVAGGLSPAVNSGDLIIAEKVIEKNDGKEILSWTADLAYVDALQKSINPLGIPVHCGMLTTCRDAVLTVAGKKDLYEQTKALAVDMESSAIARIAQISHLPFLVLRAVSDNASVSVPKDIADCLGENGRVKFAKLFKKLLQRPVLIADLLRLRKDFDAALFALGRGWHEHAQKILTATLPDTSR